MTYAEQVRNKYGDNKVLFAMRIWATETTIKRWEAGKPVPPLGMAILRLADSHTLDLKPNAPEDYAKLPAREKLEYLRAIYGDNWSQFGSRIGLDYSVVSRWRRTGKISNMGQRLLEEVASRPEIFKK